MTISVQGGQPVSPTGMRHITSGHEHAIRLESLSPLGNVVHTAEDLYHATFDNWDLTRPLRMGRAFTNSISYTTLPLYNHDMLDFTPSMTPVIKRMLPVIQSSLRGIWSSITISELSIQKICYPGAKQLVQKEPLDFQVLYYVLHRLVNDEDAIEVLGDPRTSVDKLYQVGLQHILRRKPRFINGLIDSVPSHLKVTFEQALFCAALEMNESSALEAIIHRGFDVNRILNYGRTRLYPLERSCEKKHLETTKILLENHADPNIYSRHHALGIIFGIHEQRRERHYNDLEIIHLLLKHGAKFQNSDFTGPLINRSNLTELKIIMENLDSKRFELFTDGYVLPKIFRHMDWSDDLLPIIKNIIGQKYSYVGIDNYMWNETMSNSLSRAAVTGRTRAIEVLLSAGAKPNDNCLISAVWSGNLAVFERFLNLNLDPNTVINDRSLRNPGLKDKGETTALCEAIDLRFNEAISLMIQRGFLVQSANSMDSFRLTLNAACEVGNHTIVRQLLSLQVPPWIRPWGMTAITTAIYAGQNTIVPELLSAGIKPTASSLLAAVKQRDLVLTESLRQHISFGPRDNFIAGKIVYEATRWGNCDLIKVFLQTGFPPNQMVEVQPDDKLRWGLTDCTSSEEIRHFYVSTLAVAVLEGNHEAMELLLEYRGLSAKDNQKGDLNGDDLFVSPLVACVIKDDIDLLRSLLLRGIDPFDHGAIYLATVLHRTEAMVVLFDASTHKYPHSTKDLGSGALLWATRRDDLPMLEMLAPVTDPLDAVKEETVLSNGSMSISNFSALSEAIRLNCGRSGISHALRLLLPYVKDLDATIHVKRYHIATPLVYAITLGSLPTFHELIQRGANISLPPRWGCKRTPLQAAAEKGNSDMVTFLLKKGVDPNEEPAAQGGRTALQLAAIKGHVEIATILLEAGADVNGPPSQFNGRTAFEGATELGRFEMMLFLVKHGADLLSDDQRQFRRATQLAKENLQYGACAVANELLQSVLRKGTPVRTDAEENYPVDITPDVVDDFPFQL
jgi:ankyrin repeat protein